MANKTIAPQPPMPAPLPPKGSYLDFDTVGVADEVTTPCPVVIPGKGDTGFKLYIRSMHSTAYRQAESKMLRQVSAMTTAGGGEMSDEMREDMILRTVASLVAGWTFDEPSDPEAVEHFLRRNPTMYSKVSKFAADESNFFK